MKKITMVVFMATAVLVLTGCGSSSDKQSIPAASTVVSERKPDTKMSENDSVNVPAATGKIDDTVDAIMNQATDEKTAATSDDEDAKAAANNAQELNDLNNAYDQNEIQ